MPVWLCYIVEKKHLVSAALAILRSYVSQNQLECTL